MFTNRKSRDGTQDTDVNPDCTRVLPLAQRRDEGKHRERKEVEHESRGFQLFEKNSRIEFNKSCASLSEFDTRLTLARNQFE